MALKESFDVFAVVLCSCLDALVLAVAQFQLAPGVVVPGLQIVAAFLALVAPSELVTWELAL